MKTTTAKKTAAKSAPASKKSTATKAKKKPIVRDAPKPPADKERSDNLIAFQENGRVRIQPPLSSGIRAAADEQRITPDEFFRQCIDIGLAEDLPPAVKPEPPKFSDNAVPITVKIPSADLKELEELAEIHGVPLAFVAGAALDLGHRLIDDEETAAVMGEPVHHFLWQVLSRNPKAYVAEVDTFMDVDFARDYRKNAARMGREIEDFAGSMIHLGMKVIEKEGAVSAALGHGAFHYHCTSLARENEAGAPEGTLPIYLPAKIVRRMEEAERVAGIPVGCTALEIFGGFVYPVDKSRQLESLIVDGYYDEDYKALQPEWDEMIERWKAEDAAEETQAREET